MEKISNTIRVENFLFSLMVILIVSVFVYVAWNNPVKGVTYDCRLSEISPDFPPKVREQCRNLQSRKIRNESN